ncbi:MAG: PAS sensor histidine kinase [uncultured archaeon A07HB70]|nr:MAG: PAS sensor histidine kinase [uncultured archaeon A07HB70]
MTPEPTTGSGTRVLPLILDGGNRRLLVEWIDGHPSVEPVELADGIGETTFDVCILDKAALQKYHDTLRTKKKTTAPVLLPYLLLLPESESDVVETDAGQLADNVVTETVDELVTMPIEQAELHWRLTALLRLRDQSLTLHSNNRDLERQVDLFETAQDIANVGAWEYDTDTEEWWCSDEFRRIHGVSADTPLSQTESFQYYHPEDRPTIESAFEAAVEDGEPYDLDLRLTDAENNHRWVRTIGEPQSVDGETSSVRGIVQDITERVDRQQ